METCFNYVWEKGDPYIAYFSSDEKKWINKIRKLADKFPEVEILKQPEDNDGCIYARLPADALRIQPKVKATMSEERKQLLRENLAKARMKNNT